MSIDIEKRIRFRELWHETGLELPELAEALGRSRGTLTRYSHNGASSRPPPVAILDAMDQLVLDRARALAAARGYVLKLAEEVDGEPQWTDLDVAPAVVVRQRHSMPRYLRIGPEVTERLRNLGRST